MEADNHLAALWVAAQGWLGHAGPWVVPPTEPGRPPQDLLHVLPFAALAPIDPSLAWGACAWLDALAAGLGGYALARAAGASKDASLVGAVALGAAGPAGGALVFGLSEGWSAGWFALAVAATARLAAAPSAARFAWAALPLALTVLSGWYAAAFAVLAAPFVLPWAAAGAEARGRGLVAAIAAWAVGGAAGVPALVQFVRSGEAGALAGRGHVDGPAADWWHGGLGGADVLGLVTPGIPDVELTRTAYLGILALVLAGIGVAARRGDRRLLALAAAGAWLAALALGRAPTIAGHPVGPGPAAAVTALVPPLGGLLHWSRAAAFAGVFVAPLAALGADVLIAADRRRVVALALAVGLDALVLSDAPWPRPMFDPTPPASLAALPGEGAIVGLPFDHAAKRWPADAQRPWQRWLPRLGRPIGEASEGPDGWAWDPALAWANRECAGGRDPRDVRFPGPPAPTTAPDATAGAASLAALGAAGVDWVVVVRPRAATPVRCAAWLTSIYGPPARTDDTITAWDVRAARAR